MRIAGFMAGLGTYGRLPSFPAEDSIKECAARSHAYQNSLLYIRAKSYEAMTLPSRQPPRGAVNQVR